MRTFIAITISKEMKDFLSRVQTKLKEAQGDVKWVAPENIHLTLKFLGEIDEAKLPSITHCMEEVAQLHKSFDSTLSSLGAFPSLRSPRVIWAGVDDKNNTAASIAKSLEERLEKIGFAAEERPFTTHITLGRVRSSRNRNTLAETLQKTQTLFEKEKNSCPVTNITLFKSTLTPQGPRYAPLKEINLLNS